MKNVGFLKINYLLMTEILRSDGLASNLSRILSTARCEHVPNVMFELASTTHPPLVICEECLEI